MNQFPKTEVILVPYPHSKVLSVYFIQSISLDEVFFGNYGYNATKSVGQALLKDTLNSFGQSPSANNFFSSFFQLSRKEMEDADVLTEFFKHFDLIQGFSQEASDALKEIDSSKFRSVQSALVHKLKKDCGEFESNIQNFEEFLQLLSVTSLIHGSTRTLARYFGTYSVMRWNSPNHDKWTASDATLMGSLSPGGPIHEDRHLMSIAREAGQFPRELSSVLEYYDSNSTQLKLKYQKEIRQDPAFDKLGFLLTDYCIGGLDGKQVTSCTYN